MLERDPEQREPIVLATNAQGVGAEIMLERDIERDSSKLVLSAVVL
jgi:hypothetical protein